MSAEKSAAKAQKSTIRTWTDEEKDLVWEQALLAKEENMPLTEAFRRVAKLLPHRSEAAVGMLYYNVLRKEREEPELPVKKPVAKTSEFKVDSRLLEAFQGLPEYMQQLNSRIEQLEQEQKQPDPFAIITALAQLKSEATSHTAYIEQIAALQAENQELQEENRSLQVNISKLKEAYDDALGIYDMFTNMASISQIMSLGDFKQEMKTTLDKWGNVLEITFDRQ